MSSDSSSSSLRAAAGSSSLSKSSTKSWLWSFVILVICMLPWKTFYGQHNYDKYSGTSTLLVLLATAGLMKTPSSTAGSMALMMTMPTSTALPAAVLLLVAPALPAAFAQSSTTAETFGGWFVQSKSRGFYHNCRNPPCVVPPPSYRAPKPQYPKPGESFSSAYEINHKTTLETCSQSTHARTLPT
jgi:hypothetical protein